MISTEMRRGFNLATVLMTVCGMVHLANAADALSVKTLALGESAPDFRLPAVDGHEYGLHDFDEAKVLMIVFTCNHCPTAQAYEDRLIQIAKDYTDRKVAVVAISPNDPQAVRLDELGYTDLSDSLEEMKIRAKDKKFPFPYLYDGATQKTSRAYGVQATPHVFIFDASRRLRYVGRVDDTEKGPVKSADARNAIEALLNGRDVPVTKTRVFGCSTKWSDKRAGARQSLERWNQEPVTIEKVDAAGVRTLAANATKNYRLVNVWATWCGPCVQELPELVTMNRMYRRRPFEMILINMNGVDDSEQVLAALKKCHASCRNLHFASDDHDALADALDPKWEGPLPHTVLIAPGGEVLFRKAGPIDPLELKRVIVNRLGRTY